MNEGIAMRSRPFGSRWPLAMILVLLLLGLPSCGGSATKANLTGNHTVIVQSALGTEPASAVYPTPGTGGTVTATRTTAPAPAIRYVEGSTQKVCQLTGEMDKEYNTPTINQTETRFGLVGNDLGYSFERNGKLFFLFGDSAATPTFNGEPNFIKGPPRIQGDNDALSDLAGRCRCPSQRARTSCRLR